MKKVVIFILFLSQFKVIAQEEIQYKRFNSIELGEAKELIIYIPETYEKQTNKFYPVTILLDGDLLFDVYLGNMKMFQDRDLTPEQILVGIVQDNPQKRMEETGYDKVSGLPTEESDKFYRFVRGELLDYLESQYRLSPFRTVVGSTQSANFINYFLIEKEVVFNAFVNINPLYGPDMKNFLESKLPLLKKELIYYYVNSGRYNNYEVHKKIEQLALMMKSTEMENLLVKYDIFDYSTKTSSIGQAIPGALAHIFSRYAYISPEEYSSNVQHLTPPDVIDYLKKKYIDIEYLFGTNLKIRERDIQIVENLIIDQENGKYLSEFANMIKDLYPQSPLSDYYFGMYYEKQGRYSQALKFYKNGYAKFEDDFEKAESFYQNIERVQGRQDEIIMLENEEKNERESRNQDWKEQEKAEKEMREKFRKKDKE